MDGMEFILKEDKEFSKNFKVPSALFDHVDTVIEWEGRFDVTINERVFDMSVYPSTLRLSMQDPASPIVQKVGSDTINTPSGKIFFADYKTPQVGGFFRILCSTEDSAFVDFEGWVIGESTHVLVYTRNSGEATYHPVKIIFSNC